MNNEYVIWGVPPVDKCTYCKDLRRLIGNVSMLTHDEHETVIYELAETLEEANRVMEVLTTDHGITRAHIQVMDFSDDLAAMWKNPKLINLG
jgi:hypothetical protein